MTVPFSTRARSERDQTTPVGLVGLPQATRLEEEGRRGRASELVALMERVQVGDGGAFRDVYDLTIDAAFAAALRTTWSRDHAAEVVQEVYLYVWQNALVYDAARASVLSWLLMLTHRRAVDRVRSVASASLRDQQHFHRSSPTVADCADLGIARHEAAGVRRAVRQLSEKQREAVTLTYLDGLTLREAAALLEVPLGTVKSRVHEGVASLRAVLGAQAA